MKLTFHPWCTCAILSTFKKLDTSLKHQIVVQFLGGTALCAWWLCPWAPGMDSPAMSVRCDLCARATANSLCHMDSIFPLITGLSDSWGRQQNSKTQKSAWTRFQAENKPCLRKCQIHDCPQSEGIERLQKMKGGGGEFCEKRMMSLTWSQWKELLDLPYILAGLFHLSDGSLKSNFKYCQTRQWKSYITQLVNSALPLA